MRDELIRDLMRMLKGNKKRVYAVPEDLLILLNGDGDAAIFLAQCLYWELYALKDEQGWWSKPTHEFARFGFGKSKVERVRQRLSRYLEWKVAGLPPVCHYRVRVEILMRDLFPQNEEINFPETGKLFGAERGNCLARNGEIPPTKRGNQFPRNGEIAVNSTQARIARDTDSFKREEIYTEEIQTPTVRSAAPLGRSSPSNKGAQSAGSHIHISPEEFALLAERYNIRFQSPPSDVACVFIRNLLDLDEKDGERGEGLKAIVQAFAERTNGFGGGGSSSAAAESTTTVGGQP
jgi:hypothetical protein